MQRRVECDLWYTKNTSFALDFEILLRTIAVVLGQEKNTAEAGQYYLFRGRFDELISKLKQDGPRTRMIVTPNIDHYRLLTRSSSFRRAYQNADFIINDSRLLDGIVLRGTVLCAPGSEFVPILIQAQSPGTKVCVIGYTERVEAILPSKFPDLSFSFIQPSMGYIRKRHERRLLLDRVAEFAPNLILVCTGAPQSEILSMQIKSRKELNVVVINCGSTLQFLCGAKRRAPSAVRYARAEWLWRFVNEPRTRMRYLFDALFLALSIIPFVHLRFGSHARFRGFSLVKRR
jgi:exopolysaccharide biosynthesis WecB/TagA/CpsF family protein